MGKNNSSSEFVVHDREKLKKKCERVIRQALGNQNVGFDELPLSSRNRIVYALRGDRASRAKTKKYSYSVIPILRAPYGYFWLGGTLDLLYREGNYTIEQVSLVIFQGVATDEVKTPILRAEWDAIASDGRSKHAQPHWHVYSSPLNNTIVLEYPKFSVETEVVDFSPEESTSLTGHVWERGDRFHFAMASKWHLDGVDAHQELLEQEKLLKWLEGCVGYIRAQLIYIFQ